jgi:hypothetical protein
MEASMPWIRVVTSVFILVMYLLKSQLRGRCVFQKQNLVRKMSLAPEPFGLPIFPVVFHKYRLAYFRITKQRAADFSIAQLINFFCNSLNNSHLLANKWHRTRLLGAL